MPETFTRHLCRKCYLTAARNAVGAIISGVWPKATTTAITKRKDCDICFNREAVVIFTLST
mgnify:CR=1 FL=1